MKVLRIQFSEDTMQRLRAAAKREQAAQRDMLVFMADIVRRLVADGLLRAESSNTHVIPMPAPDDEAEAQAEPPWWSEGVDPSSPLSPFHDPHYDPDQMRPEDRTKMVERIVRETGLQHLQNDPKVVRAIALAYGSGRHGMTADISRPLRIW